MLTDCKKCKLAFQIMSGVFLIAIVVCLIVDFAVNRKATWSGYPIFSILLAWGIISPLLMAKKHKALISIGFTSIAIFPFLLLLELLTPANNWFLALGVPIAALAVVAVWITYFVIKFLKINTWYLSAIFVAVYGLGVSNGIRLFTSRFLGDGFVSLDGIINTIACVAIAVLCVLVGYSKGQNQKLRDSIK